MFIYQPNDWQQPVLDEDEFIHLPNHLDRNFTSIFWLNTSMSKLYNNKFLYTTTSVWSTHITFLAATFFGLQSSLGYTQCRKMFMYQQPKLNNQNVWISQLRKTKLAQFILELAKVIHTRNVAHYFGRKQPEGSVSCSSDNYSHD